MDQAQTITLKADMSELGRVRERVQAFADVTLNPVHTNRVVLSIDEALTNIIEHADVSDSEIHLHMARNKNSLVFTLEDRGQTFDPRSVPLPDMGSYLNEGRDGGLGVFLYLTIMQVEHENRPGGGNRLTLKYDLPAGEE